MLRARGAAFRRPLAPAPGRSPASSALIPPSFPPSTMTRRHVLQQHPRDQDHQAGGYHCHHREWAGVEGGGAVRWLAGAETCYSFSALRARLRRRLPASPVILLTAQTPSHPCSIPRRSRWVLPLLLLLLWGCFGGAWVTVRMRAHAPQPLCFSHRRPQSGYACAPGPRAPHSPPPPLSRTPRPPARPVPQLVVAQDGVLGLFGRGLKTKIVANGLQGLMFSVLVSCTRRRRRCIHLAWLHASPLVACDLTAPSACPAPAPVPFRAVAPGPGLPGQVGRRAWVGRARS